MVSRNVGWAERSARRRNGLWIGSALLVGLIVGLRLVALDSDAYPRLSWSSALLTDEGFYLHNARNVVLFHRMVTDDWNNALIMPWLHFVQVGWFSLFGVGTVQARLLSVLCSLLTLGLLYDGLRRVFDSKSAGIAILFLGLDHVTLLYNRLALMDTPAALVLTAGFWFFVRGMMAEQERARALWLAGCGMALGSIYGVRGLAAFVWVAPMVAFWRSGEVSWKRNVAWLVLGLACALGFYLVAWGLPNRAELARVNRYYLFDQLVPRSVAHLGHIAWRAVFGDHRGLFSYLFRHTPVQLTLALLWFVGRQRVLIGYSPVRRATIRFLEVWLVLGWLILCVAAYAPSRYHVLWYPALAGIAALGLQEWGTLCEAWLARRAAIAAVASFLLYHLGQVVFHRLYRFDDLILLALCVIAGVALYGITQGSETALRVRRQMQRVTPVGMLALWGVVNTGWTGDWILHRTYHQRDAERWLVANLPPDSVLFGAVGMGLTLDTRFQAINVIKKLCNDDHPLERFASAPRYVVILDDRWKEQWWGQHYPDVVAPGRQIHEFRGLLRPFFTIRVYPVPPNTRWKN